MLEEQATKKLNAEIPASLKKRLDMYCCRHDYFIYYVVAQAIEEYLDRACAAKE